MRRFLLVQTGALLKLRLRACFACLHDLVVFFLRNRMADAFEQMIWKSCLQGLLQEASMIVCGVEQYYLETSDNDGEAMCALREKMASTIWSHEWGSEAYHVCPRSRDEHSSPGSTVSENTLNDEAAPSDP